MSVINKLIQELLTVPSDFSFDKLRKIMKFFGYLESKKGKTSGSRVRFYHPETKAVLNQHDPHPQNIMKKGAIRSAIDFLKEHGHI